MKYQLINLDVWGNKEDGYEVNEAFPTSEAIDLPYENYDTMADEEMDIIDLLNLFALRNVSYDQVTVDNSTDIIYINDAESDMPLYNLLPVDEHNQDDIKTVYQLDKYRAVHPATREL